MEGFFLGKVDLITGLTEAVVTAADDFMFNDAGTLKRDTIQGILTNFPDYTPDKARAKVSDFVSSLQVVQNMFQNKKLKIKNNPGFLTTISKDKFDNTPATLFSFE